MTPPDQDRPAGGPGLLGTVAGAATRAATRAAQQLGQHLPAPVAGRIPGASAGQRGPVQQTVTTTAGSTAVLDALADAEVLSRLLGDLGGVEPTGDDGRRWAFTTPGGDGARAGACSDAGPTWECSLTRRPDGLRYEGQGSHLDVQLAPAPGDRGVEVRLRADLPVPAAAAGAAAFTLLYRLRALLQTGEVPTLGPQPAARDERG